MMDLALFRPPEGPAWIGYGPFTEATTCPDSASAFYINDFALSDPKPWKIPARLEVAETASLPADNGLSVRWEKPVTEWFKMAFRRIRREVMAGRLEKMVPVLTEQGHVVTGDTSSLLRRVLTLPGSSWGYGRFQGHSGFAGATPELLFSLKGNQIKTMALAGTAKPGADEAFLKDAKEIDEHEIVVRYLLDRLSPLGTAKRAERGICETAGLRHFHSAVEVETSQPVAADDLVNMLHPTPAVGCLPRTEEWLAKLNEYRNRLKVPGFFGAPFGFSHQGSVQMVVSIRGISWDGTAVVLPSGCGVVGGSAFDHEWRELRLKRESVVRMLGL